MNYMGGKHRQGKKIAKFINDISTESTTYVEPFCGALGVARWVEPKHKIMGDTSEALINMWTALMCPSVELPDVITEEMYNYHKSTRNPKDWMCAYVGFGMSFGSKWFGGYARNSRGTNYAANLKRSTNLKRSMINKSDVKFVHSSYENLDFPNGSVVYCDPPYAGRTKAHNFDSFDHEKFWEWCRAKVAEGNTVLVTEFVVPDDFVVLHDFGDTVVRHHSGKKPDGTREVLVCHESQRGLWS